MTQSAPISKAIKLPKAWLVTEYKISESKNSIVVEYIKDDDGDFKGLSIPMKSLTEFARSEGYLEFFDDSAYQGSHKQKVHSLCLCVMIENEDDLVDEILINYINKDHDRNSRR